MQLNNLLQKLIESPDSIEFNDTMSVIDSLYEFTPTPFKNGSYLNEAGKNNGSCKLFSFAQLHKLSPQQTLHCFGAYYREDVLGHPEGTDHQNIRNFIKTGWAGIEFSGNALAKKTG
jgi:hypothetical protein